MANLVQATNSNQISAFPFPVERLLDGVQAGIFVVDHQLDLLFINDWWAIKTGVTDAQTLDNLLDSEAYAASIQPLDTLFETEQDTHWQSSLLTANGDRAWVQCTAQPLWHETELAAAQVTFIDITLQNELAAKVARYEQELERQRRESAALYTIGVSCSLTMDPFQVLRLIYVQADSLFPFTTFAIVLYDATTGQVSPALVIRHGKVISVAPWSLDADHGAIGYSIRNAAPLLIRDWPREVDQLLLDRDKFIDQDTHSWLSVPLVGQEGTLGLICLQHDQVNAFSELDQRSLYAIADQATMVLENTRLHEQTAQQLKELRQANRDMQALQDLGHALQSSLDLDRVLHAIVDRVAEWLDYDLVALAVVQDNGSALQLRAVAAKSNTNRIRGSLAALEWPMSDTGAETQQSLVLQAALESSIATTDSLHKLFAPELSRPVATELQQMLEIDQLATVPLSSRERLVGSLIVGTKRSAISNRELALLSAFAGQSSIAIENAQLYQSQRRRITQLEAIRDFGQQIASYLSLQDLVTNAAELLRTRFNYHHVQLYLWDEQKETLVLEAQSGTQDKENEEATTNSLVAWVTENRQSRLQRDATALTTNQDALNGSALAVPILLGDELLGALQVQSLTSGTVDESDLYILESVSNRLAAGIEGSRLYDQVNQQLAEVSTLYMLAEQISSSLETSVVLDRVVNVLKRVLNCRGCVIFLLDDNREWLEIQVSSGIKPQWHREARMRLGEGISGKVAQTAQPIYIPDTHQDPDFIIFDPAVRSLLVVPLTYKGQVIGTLNVDDDTCDAFAAEADRLLAIAATQAAAAIQNARLFEALKERAERLAKAHQELQESDRIRSEFVQNMSHELRTPLTFVKGYVELFLEEALGSLTDIQRESMQIVADRTNRVIQLVNEILTLQQVERGELEFSAISLSDIAHAEVRSARAMAQQQGLLLIEDYAPDLQPALGDPHRLDRVFVNLIGNAIKFTPSGGTITIRLRNQGDFCQVDVIDEGIGIPQDQLDKIFDRFYQVDGSTTRRYGGTGLGLAIVKEIITAHGGTISVSSTPGEGSTFTFTVPASPD